MADSRKEVVSSSRKMTSRQESTSSSSTVQQQQQQQQQISSTTQSQSVKQQSQTTVVSTSSIQLEKKQEVRNQIQSQSSITQSSKQQQIQMQNQSVTQSSNQVTQQQQQKSVTQKQVISQNQIQNQTSIQQQQLQQQQQQLLLQQQQQQQQQLQQQQLELQNHNDEEQNGEEDLKARKKKKKVKKTESFSVKSSFSKFENAAGNPNNRATPENDEERANKAKNENAKSGTKICKGCDREVFVMEMIKAEKASWHKQCFRCVECKKSLSVDTYESNAGQLYCKPHFKELFQPKAVLESPEEKLRERIRKRPEVIIRENEPVELPPDVVRASVQPSTAELEDLSVDVRSKFELFEHYQDSETTKKEREPVIVKKSTTVLAKLAKYQGAMDGVGIPDADLNGGAPAVVSEDEDDDNMSLRKPQPFDEINIKLDDVKSKWESGMNGKKEEIHKHRQEEMNKFRTRLCLGKNSQLKEMYEKAVESSENEVRRNSDLEQLDFKAKRDIKEMFEKGIVRPNDDDEEEIERETAVDRDREVFENGVAKNSRNLFQNLDKQLSSGGQTPPILPSGPKKIALRNPKDIIGVNDQSDIVKSTDVIEEQIRTEDVGNKFRFFETYQEKQETKQKKVFRITPPREGQVKMDSPEREIYRDPNVVRSTDTEHVQIPASRTASKMLSVFKKMEETAAGSDEVDLSRPQRRPLKQFTPPRETRIERKNSSEDEEEAEQSSEYETDEEYENGGANIEQDQFLKEVGSLAKAKSLRAKFEKWEIEENNRNQQQTKMEYLKMQQQQSLSQTQNGQNQQEQSEETFQSIESAKALRAKFEQPQQFEQNKLQRREVQVKRFV